MTAKIKLNAASGGGSVSLKAPSTTTSNAAVELQLPVADGSAGQFMKTDGSGNLSFDAAGGGKILQVKQTVKTDTASTSSSTFADVFTVSITPTASSSKFLLFGDLKIGFNDYRAAIMWKFVKTVSSSDTDLFIGDADGNRARCTWGIEEVSSSSDNAKYELYTTNGIFLDSPNTTSAITYRVKWKAQQYTGYLNRTGDDANGTAYPRTASSLTVMEVAA